MPSPIPTNARQKDRNRYASLGVHLTARAPDASGPQRACDALQALWPDVFATSSAAKKACRRGLVLVDDLVADTATEVRSLAPPCRHPVYLSTAAPDASSVAVSAL